MPRRPSEDLTAFVQVFAQATGLALDSPANLQAASVAHWRTFWRCLAAWAGPDLGWSGAVDPVCEGHDGEHTQFFPALRLNYAASLLSPAIARNLGAQRAPCPPYARAVRTAVGERVRVVWRAWPTPCATWASGRATGWWP